MKENRITRRHAKTLVKGRKIKVLTFIRERAKDLPPIIDRVTGKNFDHTANLRKCYMEQGAEGVNKYVARCQAISEANPARPILTRVKGKLKLFWYKLLA